MQFAAHMGFGRDILGEIGEHRYFVVPQAYDFPTARTHKKLKPLWTIRMSISEAGKPFSEALGSMLASATRYIGRDSKGLRRENLQDGQVEVGPTEVIEVVPER